MDNTVLNYYESKIEENSTKCKLIQHLQEENKSLIELVNFQQKVISCIMSIYRQQVIKLLAYANIKIEDKYNEQYKDTIMSQAKRIDEMLQVMKNAISTEHDNEDIRLNVEEELYRLNVENRGLRELLNIAYEYGSIQKENEQEKVSEGESEDGSGNEKRNENINRNFNDQVDEAVINQTVKNITKFRKNYCKGIIHIELQKAAL
uniref:Uncharacterized protein n=1 Tax=Rhodnius prolixus TaxID=13249 RepID=A0A4P6D711_RHOPR